MLFEVLKRKSYEHTIYECKCSRQKRPFSRAKLLQLLGYILLDSNDTYTLRSAGWYYARQQKRIVYPITELTERIFRTKNLEEVRNSFYETLQKYHESRLNALKETYENRLKVAILQLLQRKLMENRTELDTPEDSCSSKAN